MILTTAQKATLKAAIQNVSDTNQAYVDGNLSLLADLLNALAAPAFWVWRTNVSRAEIYNETSAISDPQSGFAGKRAQIDMPVRPSRRWL